MSQELKLRLMEEPPPLPVVLPPPPPPPASRSDQEDTEQADMNVKHGAEPKETPSRESLGKGILGGTVAALVGALLWATLSAVTLFQIGWMAVGVGTFVGYGVRWLGKGTRPRFGVAGATLALSGCLFGNLLAYCIIGAHEVQIPFGAALQGLVLEPQLALELMYDGFGPFDFLFYFLAIGAAYRVSFRHAAAEY